MKGFDYTLENVLNLRMKTEDDRLADFARAKKQYHEHLESVKDIEGEIGETQKSFISIKGNGLESIRHHYYYLENLRDKKLKSEDLVKEAGRTCEVRRQAYEKAQIKRKTIEMHREKKLEAYNSEQKKLEERMLDEMAVTAFKRKREL